ncbi:MAG: hypothetical protein M1462_03695 [Candidatus Thermoplasmatota archaeon]|jgi:hypothetical protein|uniref:hypothetical protein n=2 Tax=Ferroplasma TaxID=74968 RepID=UPI00260EA644|nr:hypothetical protein [Ferroplasma sp.]MCL4311515.1 hypothetical protein [Candidatus Thermoplasmatota archaeon]
MNLKSHYKIIISIIIVIILFLPLIIYYYPYNNTEYNNNGESVDVKYFHNEYSIYACMFNSNYSASSYSTGNSESYLNTTLTNPAYYQLEGQLMSHINISMKNINARYVYITTTGSNNDQYVQITGTHTPINCKQEGNKWINKYSSFDNLHSMGINFGIPTSYLHNGNYNFTLTISAGKLHNTFYIDTEKESAIYGTVGSKPRCSDGNHNYNISYNSTMFVYNINTTSFRIVKINNGQFYFFTNPGNWYKIYYLNGENLSVFKNNNGNNITIIKMPLSTISKEYNIYE